MEVSFSFDKVGEDAYQLHVRHGAHLMVSIDDEERLNALCGTLYDLHDGSSYGNIWKVVEAVVLSGVNIPMWPRYLADLQQLYRSIHPVALRELVRIGEAPRKKEWRVREDTILRLKAARYVPDEVGLPDFLEGPPVDNSILQEIQASHSLSDETIIEYYLKSWRGRQFSKGPHFDFDYLSYEALRDIGLIQVGKAIPLIHLAHGVQASALKTALSHLGRSYGPYRNGNAADLANAAQSDGVTTDDLKDYLGDIENLHCIVPPDGLDWDDFQSWRQQIKGMGELFINLWEGKVRRYSQDYAILTATL